MIRFCFYLTGCGLFAVALLSAADQSAEPRRVVSIVRADGRSGRLVRAVVSSRLAAPSAGNAGSVNVGRMVEQAARLHNVDPVLLHSVIAVESSYNPFAISPKGAQGLMQLIPSTARRFGVKNSFSPEDNIAGGARYLRHLLDLFKNERLAVAAYNAGEEAVIRYGGIPPYPETRNYVDLVGKRYNAAKRGAANNETVESTEDAQPVIEQFVDDLGRIHIRTR